MSAWGVTMNRNNKAHLVTPSELKNKRESIKLIDEFETTGVLNAHRIMRERESQGLYRRHESKY